MRNLTRRSFLKLAAAGAAAYSLDARTWSRAAEANSDLRVAQIGFRGQGSGHIATLIKMKGVRLVALCDVDKDVMAKKVKELDGKGITGLATYTDIRKLLENKDIDAVSIAVPNHWHALATVWACQAGKDVYVEKPASHDIFEGRKMVEAARKYNRIVQTGTQCRSSVGLQEAVKFVQDGKLGKILVSRGFCYKARQSIGLVDGPQAVPESIDYDLWCGPAPVEPPRRNSKQYGPVHYNWHWFWAYGNGDYGNQGPHQVDIARWFLGEQEIAPFSMAVGGRLGYKDSAETPNTLITYHGYKIPLVFEVRGLPKDKESQTKGWKMDNYKGASIGNVIECENGYVVVPSYTTAIVYDKDGKEVQKFDGKKKGAGEDVKTPAGLTAESGGHHGNWIAAIRARDPKILHADILVGHMSAGLVHTGNTSFRLGANKQPAEIKDALKDNKLLGEAFDRMAAHLDANGVDITKDNVQLGVPLKFDPKTEKFEGNEQANAMLKRNYRKPFEVPEQV